MSKTARDRLTPVGDTADRPVYYDEREGTFHVWWDDTDYEPVTTAVITAVSSIRGVEPADLESLSSRVDPDALNAVAADWYGSDRRHESAVTIPFARCTVTVHADGEIVIEPDRTADVAIEF